MSELIERIKGRVNRDLERISPQFRDWTVAHLVEPRIVQFSIDSDGKELRDFWLVTDHVGNQDSSYRVAYDAITDSFGLETTLMGGVEWYMGSYGEFFEAIDSM